MTTPVDCARALIERAMAQVAGPRERLLLLRELTDLTSFVAAAQAELSADVHRDVVSDRVAAGAPRARAAEGIAAEIAVARRESPHRGGQLLSLARTLTTEMPRTLAAMRAGVLSEYRASVIVRETRCLDREDRGRVDREVCADLERIAGWGTQRLAAEARRLAYRLDADAATARAAQARDDRHAGLRPAPDTMTWFGALPPVEHGVAVQATLRRLADGAVAAGDGRSRGQLMADGLVERVTGLDLGVSARQQDPTAWAGTKSTDDRSARPDEVVPVSVQLVVSDETLLDGGDEPGWLSGYGPLPAPLTRRLVALADQQVRASLRRLYAAPATGSLAAVDSRARLFPAGLTRLVTARDRSCRTPWCDAPLRHVDHVVAHTDGGATSLSNGQGLCARCNLAKQAPGWASRVVDSDGDRPHEVEVVTPHGLRERSRAPAAPRPHPLREVPPHRVELYPDARFLIDPAA